MSEMRLNQMRAEMRAYIEEYTRTFKKPIPYKCISQRYGKLVRKLTGADARVFLNSDPSFFVNLTVTGGYEVSLVGAEPIEPRRLVMEFLRANGPSSVETLANRLREAKAPPMDLLTDLREMETIGILRMNDGLVSLKMSPDSF